MNQAEGNEQSPPVRADATDAKYVLLSVAYVADAEGGGERAKRRGIGRLFCLFLSPHPTPLFAPTTQALLSVSKLVAYLFYFYLFI